MLEVCIAADSPHLTQNLTAAKQGGARRIELCRAMDKDGLTPAPETISRARRVLGGEAQLLVMIRNHTSDFCVTATQLPAMLRQIEMAAQCGADGVVVGALSRDGHVDTDCTQALVDEAHRNGLSLTFHRAFDAITNPSNAAQQLADLGVERVLSAGQPWARTIPAEARLQQFMQLASTFPKSLELVVGGGVSAATLPIFSALTQCYARLSFHSFSAVLANGQVRTDKVCALCRQIHSFSQRAV